MCCGNLIVHYSPESVSNYTSCIGTIQRAYPLINCLPFFFISKVLHRWKSDISSAIHAGEPHQPHARHQKPRLIPDGQSESSRERQSRSNWSLFSWKIKCTIKCTWLVAVHSGCYIELWPHASQTLPPTGQISFPHNSIQPGSLWQGQAQQCQCSWTAQLQDNMHFILHFSRFSLAFFQSIL